MDPCSQPELGDYHGTSPSPDNPNIWVEQHIDYHGASMHGFLGNRSEFDNAWYAATEPASFSFQTTGVASGTWANFGGVLMQVNDKLVQDMTGDPQAMANDTQSYWGPTGCTHLFDIADQHKRTVGSDCEVPWLPGARNISLENHIASIDAQQDVAREHTPPSCGRSSDSDNSDTAIGTALKNGRFKCNMTKCKTKTFKRPAELRRHYYTTHAVQKPEFWCEVLHCDRSAAAGGRPFHRKYRVQDHMRKIHGSVGSICDSGQAEE